MFLDGESHGDGLGGYGTESGLGKKEAKSN